MRSCLAACRKAFLKVRPGSLPIAGEVGRQALLKQPAGLLRHDFELLDRSGAQDLHRKYRRVRAVDQLLEGRLQRINAADEEIRSHLAGVTVASTTAAVV